MTQVNPDAGDGPQPDPTDEEERESRQAASEIEPTEAPGHDHTEEKR